MKRPWVLGVFEIATSFVVAALFVVSCRHIAVDASERLGQVSALAAVEWRFLLFALPLVIILIVAARLRDGVHFDESVRFVCAALAGLASGAVAGGIVVILHRTPFGLGATNGDAGTLISWAERLNAGNGTESSIYPPLQVYLLAWMSKLSGVRAAYMLPLFQIVGVAVVGPFAYASWRLLLRPRAALIVAVVSALPMIEAYRQYPLLTLVIMVPVLLKFLQVLRYSATDSLGRTIRCGAMFGVVLGLLFLLYSGWFQWSGPGFMVAAAIIFPWRNWKQGALLIAIASVVFGLITYRYLTGVVHGSALADSYVYFDANVEPAFVAMWRGGLPGTVGVWPPFGELGGVGLFTLVLATGLGIAVAFGRKRTTVIGVVSILVGTWLFRMWHAHRMWQTKLVQLWPRTTAEVLYLLLVLTCFAALFTIDRAKRKAAEDSILRTPSGFIGVVAALVLVLASASSATIDKYMPKQDGNDTGILAWSALHRPPLEDNQLVGATIAARTSLETDRWSVGGAIDHKLWRGYSSELGHKEDHVEWLDLNMHQARDFSRVVFWPAMDGSPIELSIDVWDGAKWSTDSTVTGFPQMYMAPQTIKLTHSYQTDLVRLRATKLRQVDGDYVFRVAEVELYE
jgi:hypothetical protein